MVCVRAWLLNDKYRIHNWLLNSLNTTDKPVNFVLRRLVHNICSCTWTLTGASYYLNKILSSAEVLFEVEGGITIMVKAIYSIYECIIYVEVVEKYKNWKFLASTRQKNIFGSIRQNLYIVSVKDMKHICNESKPQFSRSFGFIYLFLKN